jgi:hypothetical protein
MATSSSGRRHPRDGESGSTDIGTRHAAPANEDLGMNMFLTTDDPVMERTEQLLRRLNECPTAEHAELLMVRELPLLVGADWAILHRSDATGSGGLSEFAHRRLAAAAAAAGCVYSIGDPPTVAAVPLRGVHGPIGVILVGRDAGLCGPQLRMVGLFAEHANTLLPAARLAATA